MGQSADRGRAFIRFHASQQMGHRTTRLLAFRIGQPSFEVRRANALSDVFEQRRRADRKMGSLPLGSGVAMRATKFPQQHHPAQDLVRRTIARHALHPGNSWSGRQGRRFRSQRAFLADQKHHEQTDGSKSCAASAPGPKIAYVQSKHQQAPIDSVQRLEFPGRFATINGRRARNVN